MNDLDILFHLSGQFFAIKIPGSYSTNKEGGVTNLKLSFNKTSDGVSKKITYLLRSQRSNFLTLVPNQYLEILKIGYSVECAILYGHYKHMGPAP